MVRLSPHRRPGTTTFRRSLLLPMLTLGASLPIQAAEPTDEAELVRRTLASPVATTDLDAVDAQTRANRTAVPLLDSPTLDARHEDTYSDGSATTNAIGASLTIDLGLSPLAYSRAGRIRGNAGDHHREAVALASVCDVRADALDLWAANLAASLSQTSQERLDGLLDTQVALANAGESSGYDRDRTALAVATHRTEVDDRAGAAEVLRARLTALAGGEPVVDVALAALPATPGLAQSLEQLSSHPALQSLTLEVDAAKADRDAARLDQIPDLTISGGRRWDATSTGSPASPGFEVGGSVEIPWTNGGRAEARQQTADHAAAEAHLARTRAELEAAVRGAHRRVDALATTPKVAINPDAVWAATMDRYAAGETSLDDLLQVAEAVEAARLAEVERERLLRRAHLDLSCAIGQFPEPAIQSALEEAVR
jgi:outer membrane protein TolC